MKESISKSLYTEEIQNKIDLVDLLNQLPGAILLLNKDGFIVFSNSKMNRTFGKEQLMHRQFKTVCSEIHIFDKNEVRVELDANPILLSFQNDILLDALSLGLFVKNQLNWFHVSTSYLNSGTSRYFMVSLSKQNQLIQEKRTNERTKSEFEQYFIESPVPSFQVIFNRPVVRQGIDSMDEVYKYVMSSSSTSRTNKAFDPFEARHGNIWEDSIDYSTVLPLNKDKASAIVMELMSEGSGQFLIESAPYTLKISYDLIKSGKNKVLGYSGWITEFMDSGKTELDSYMQQFHGVEDIVFFKDLEGRYIGGNLALTHHIGKNLNEIIGSTDYQIFNKSKARKYVTSDKKVIKTGSQIKTEDVRFLSTGLVETYEIIKTPLRNKWGQINGVMGIGRNVTERERATKIVQVLLRFQELMLQSDEISEGLTNAFNYVLEELSFDSLYFIKNNPHENSYLIEVEQMVSRDDTYKRNFSNTGVTFKDIGLERWEKSLLNNRLIKRKTEDFPADERQVLESIQVKSILCAPIFAFNNFYGVLSLIHEKLSREWDELDEVFVKGITNILTGIIEKNRNIEIIRDQNEQLKKANAELDRFVYSASHDLKAPIASIKGLIYLMETEQSEGRDVSEFIKHQNVQINKLDKFIKDIIDYSRNSRIAVNKVKISILNLINDVYEGLNNLPNAAKIEFSLICNEDKEVMVDEFRLRVVLNNLLSNAIKFSRKDGIESPQIHVGIELKDSLLSISVEDNGEGINEAYLPHVFDMFYRATESSEGSGLGLYIVKETIQKMGGEIHATSIENKGTTFVFTIPL